VCISFIGLEEVPMLESKLQKFMEDHKWNMMKLITII
jgi:hypothetical protein